MYCQGWSHSKALVLSLGCVLKSPGSFQNYHLLDPTIESYSWVWVGGIFSRLPRYAHVQSLAMLFLITFTWEQASQPPRPTVLPHSVPSWVGMGSDGCSILELFWDSICPSLPVEGTCSGQLGRIHPSQEFGVLCRAAIPLAGSKSISWICQESDVNHQSLLCETGGICCEIPFSSHRLFPYPSQVLSTF